MSIFNLQHSLWVVVMFAASMRRRSIVVAFHSQPSPYHCRIPKPHFCAGFVNPPISIQKNLFFHRSRSTIVPLAKKNQETDATVEHSKTTDSEWDVPGLKKQVARLIQRCHKKIGQANQRLTKAQDVVEDLESNPNPTLEELDSCPNVDKLAAELEGWQTRLRNLNDLEGSLLLIKKKKSVLNVDMASQAIALGVDDSPPARPPRPPPKPKGKKEAPRKPYRRYYSFNSIEIRVGKKAEDNDELSTSPLHRDGTDWWMHASGCPGSHVVIRSALDNLPDEVVQDAAALAARQSKCAGNVIKVSLTRCRDVKKPPGAKAGLVMLTGKVQTISVNMKAAETRFERLESTVVIN